MREKPSIVASFEGTSGVGGRWPKICKMFLLVPTGGFLYPTEHQQILQDLPKADLPSPQTKLLQGLSTNNSAKRKGSKEN